MARRLTESHPTYKKVEQLFGLMEELGLSIEKNNYFTKITDKAFPEMEFYLKDSDDGTMVDSFPPFMEYKLIIADSE